tara:strand:+ start:464 stop:766 length:303 start_codon:yes stop_codon:yes gene_type:complete
MGLIQSFTCLRSPFTGSLLYNLLSQSKAIKNESEFVSLRSSGLISEYFAMTERKPLLLYLIELGSINTISLLILDTSFQLISSANNLKELKVINENNTHK